MEKTRSAAVRERARERRSDTQGPPSGSGPRRRLAAIVATGSALIALGGCTDTPDTPDTAPESTAQQPVTTVQRMTDDLGAQALSVYWEPTASAQKSNVLRARVKNSTTESKKVTLTAVGVDPHGETVTRPLGTRTVAPKSETEVTIHVADLPCQSTDLSSAISILAEYELAWLTPTNEKSTVTHSVHSAPLHVTSQADWSAAIVRTVAEQANANATFLAKAAQRPGKVKRAARAGGEQLVESVADLPVVTMTDGTSKGQSPTSAGASAPADN